MTAGAKRILAIIMIIVFSGLLGLLPYVAYVAKQVREMREDFCPKGGYWQNYFGITEGEFSVVLVDTSNAIPQKDGKAAAVWVEKWLREFPPFQRISIRDLPKTAKNDSQFRAGPWCVSWSKGTAPSWLTGSLVAERDFRKKFLTAVQTEFDKAVNLPEADESPILETLAALKKEGVNNVFLVSDMLQHTDIEKHYGNIPLCEGDCPDVKGLSVNVHYIQREGVNAPANHRQIWEEHIGKKITWHLSAEE